MTTTVVTEKAARSGVQGMTGGTTKIQVQLASVEILVGGPYKNRSYGHAALHVVTKEGERVYDYGRYGNTWGVGDSEGEGILNVWTNFNVYIASENSLGRITTGFVYEVQEEKAKAINDFFVTKIGGKKPKAFGRSKSVYVIEDYYALGTNCTTLTVQAAKVALPNIDREASIYNKGRGLGIMEKGLVQMSGWPPHIFMPTDLQKMIEGDSSGKLKRIKTYGSK